MKIFILLSFLVGFRAAYAAQSSDSFTVTANDDHFHVVAPVNWKNGTSMILQNKTLVPMYGEVRAGVEQRRVGSFSVRPGEFMSMDLGLNKGESATVVPLSPPFQEVILQFGRTPYEIPPQR